MRFDGPPEHACAVLVGVEQCGVYADDPLVGPVRDAIDWYHWLVARGVPPARITVMLSPKPVSQPLVDAWRQSWAGLPAHEQPRLLPATEQAFRNVVCKDLPAQAAEHADGSLLLLWSGHGVIDQRSDERTRRLFYGDADAELSLNLEPVSLMKALRSQPFAGLRRQLLVVDACANFVMSTARHRRLPRPTDFAMVTAEGRIEQRVLLAAAPGQVAQSAEGLTVRESVALFSSRLLAALGQPPAGQWPDFGQAYEQVRQTFELSNQTPVDWCHDTPDDRLNDRGVLLAPDVQTAQLLAALRSVPTDCLSKAFRAALADLPLTEAQQDAAGQGPAEMAALLHQLPSAGPLPPPLMRWALQVHAALGDEATHRQHRKLQHWIEDQADPVVQAYRQQIAAARVPAPVPCFVLVLEKPLDDPGVPSGSMQLQAWLFAGEPLQRRMLHGDAPLLVQPDGSGRAQALRTLMKRASEEAADPTLGIGEPDFIIEYALPLARLDDAVEAHPIAVGLGSSQRPLANRYPLVRRVAERLEALAHRQRSNDDEIRLWRAASELLRPRLVNQGLRIHWIELAHIADGLLRSRLQDEASGSCVGLARPQPAAQLDDEAKDIVYVDGLAFACWADTAWTDADTQMLDQGLQACRGAQVLRKLFELRQADAEHRQHPVSRLRLLWDDPQHNPYATRLGA